jgi:hypothetical protein
MVRSGHPTGVLIPVVYLFGGEESKAKNSKVAHEYAELLTVKIRQPSHEFTFGVGMTFVSYPLVLTPVV